MSVKIGKIDVVAEEDMYRRNGQMTTTEMWISPQKRLVIVEQYHRSGSTSVDVWHRRELTFSLNSENGVQEMEQEPPDGDSLKELLESDEGQALLDRICDGHDIDWDGNNMVGSLDEDAQIAVQELLEAINDLPRSSIVTWMVDDWFGHCTDSDLGLRKLMSYRQIRKLSEQFEKDAKHDHIHLEGNVYDYLVERQKEMRNG